jgi:hypothetical protein
MKLSPEELQSLSGFGFDIEKGRASTVNTNRRIIMAVCAMEKCGKTTFGLSAPGPTGYFNFDRKVESAVLEMLGIGESDLYIREIRVNGTDPQDKHQAEWEEVHAAFLWMLSSDNIRTIVVDTESEMWELARMAAFGKLTQVMPYQYTMLNSMYKNMLDQCDKHNKNVIFLRKMKKQYKNDVWSGRYEPSGFAKLKDIVQVNAEMYIDDDDGFTFEVINNAFQAQMNHQTFSGDMCTFKWVASLLTNTTPDEWE